MKMKYEICLLCVILICASVCSCDSESDIQPNSNLTISLEMPESPEHVPSYYQAERIYLDTDTLVEYFFAGESPLQPEMENITGEVFYTTQKQLTNHNGGLVSQLPGADAYFGGLRKNLRYIRRIIYTTLQGEDIRMKYIRRRASLIL